MSWRIGRGLGAALALGATLFVARPALAEALVVVEVRTAEGEPADGRVVLRPRGGDGREHSCTTSNGSCRITGVPGGRYVVTFEPASGPAPAPRNAMIPPEGTVTLRVAAR